MALDSNTISVIVATISVVGFTIVVAIPTISSTFYVLLSESDEYDTAMLELEAAYRLIKRFAQTPWVIFFGVLSLAFIMPGAFVVLEALLGSGTIWIFDLYDTSILLLFIGLVGFTSGTFWAFLRSTILLPSDVKMTISYLSSAKPAIRGVRRQRLVKRCPRCGTQNGRRSKFCRMCGAQLPD